MAVEQGIKVVHGDITAQATALAKMKNELEENFQRAQQQVMNLHESGAFVGSAGTSFQDKYKEWNTSIVHTLQLMEEFGTHLGKTSDAFAKIDEAYSLK